MTPTAMTPTETTPMETTPTETTPTNARNRVIEREGLFARWAGVGTAQDDELDAAVLRPARLVVLRAHRLGLAVAMRLQPIGLDAVLDEVRLDRRRAILGQLHVVVVVAA